MKYLIPLFLILSVNAQALPDDYQLLDSKDKQSILWENIIASTYEELPVKNPSLLESLKLLNWKKLLPSFRHVSDELPEGRKKLIHTYGAVARLRWVPTNDHNYTGIFNTGGDTLARVGRARQGGPVIAGMGLKVLVDSSPSVNLHIMYRLEGQGLDGNIFKHPFTNDLPRPKFIPSDLFFGSFTIAARFLKEGSSPLYLPPTHLSKIDRFGKSIEDYKSPEVLEFHPSKEAMLSSSLDEDYREKIKALSPGITLYEIYAKEKRDSKELIKIGELILESEFVSSKYGDEKLFFQHNIED